MHNVESTKVVRMPDGNSIRVEELPDELQQHIKVLDKLRDDVSQKRYELQVYQIALNNKREVIAKLLTDHSLFSQSGIDAIKE